MNSLVNPQRVAGACRPIAAAAVVLETALRDARADFDAVSTNTSADEASALNLRFTSAMELYKAGDWSHAFSALAALADLGHVPAARLALLMLRYGTGWFRTPFGATPEQVARWARQILREGLRSPAATSYRESPSPTGRVEPSR